MHAISRGIAHRAPEHSTRGKTAPEMGKLPYIHLKRDVDEPSAVGPRQLVEGTAGLHLEDPIPARARAVRVVVQALGVAEVAPHVAVVAVAVAAAVARGLCHRQIGVEVELQRQLGPEDDSVGVGVGVGVGVIGGLALG